MKMRAWKTQEMPVMTVRVGLGVAAVAAVAADAAAAAAAVGAISTTLRKGAYAGAEKGKE